MYLLKTDAWYLERILFLMGGSVALASAILAWLHSPYWLILTIFVGLNQIVFALTGFCPSAILLVRLGAKPKLQKIKEKGSRGQGVKGSRGQGERQGSRVRVK